MQTNTLLEHITQVEKRLQVAHRRFAQILQVTSDQEEQLAIAGMITWTTMSMETARTMREAISEEAADQDLSGYAQAVRDLDDDLTSVEEQQSLQMGLLVQREFLS